MNNLSFDIHCHIFTLRYALKEAKNMLRDMMMGTYPWHPPDVSDEIRLTAPDRAGIGDSLKQFLRQFFELISASFGSEEENLDFLLEEYSKAMPGSTWRVVPLMMDIFYMLAYPLEKEQEATRAGRAPLRSIKEAEFQKAWDDILDDLKKQIEEHIRSTDSGDELARSKGVNHFLEAIDAEREVGRALTLEADELRAEGTAEEYYHTEGYCFHLDNLVKLVESRKGELYPFIAIDPRRPGILDEIIGGGYIGTDGPFYGVKLYPRMGYHPQSLSMDTLYDYCNRQQIPITFHCGKSGFPPGTEWKHADFGNPAHFEPILQNYPDLNINFAHLGSADPSYEWAHEIINLMNTYGTVYSDLSCYTDIENLKAIRKLWDDNPILESQLMFGTDFDVMYLTDQVTMASYFANFEEIFSKEELKLLMHENPMKFFGDIIAPPLGQD
ncbi:MAG: amidohydrolase family protein [Deltaproteobacteria bacterium]|nr:amidohydrolase family protein [Candidatus Zymogenaceae bacterium]